MGWLVGWSVSWFVGSFVGWLMVGGLIGHSFGLGQFAPPVVWSVDRMVIWSVTQPFGQLVGWWIG